jgi:hypothetical protein
MRRVACMGEITVLNVRLVQSVFVTEFFPFNLHGAESFLTSS